MSRSTLHLIEPKVGARFEASGCEWEILTEPEYSKTNPPNLYIWARFVKLTTALVTPKAKDRVFIL